MKKRKKTNKNNARFLKELKSAIKEVNLAKQGKIKLQSAGEFLNEL